jgi:hypothetical protein
VYFQKKSSEKKIDLNGQTGTSTPSFGGNEDDNSSSGTGGTTPPEYST